MFGAAVAAAPAESANAPLDNLWETMRLEELRVAAKAQGVRISDIETTVAVRAAIEQSAQSTIHEEESPVDQRAGCGCARPWPVSASEQSSPAVQLPTGLADRKGKVRRGVRQKRAGESACSSRTDT